MVAATAASVAAALGPIRDEKEYDNLGGDRLRPKNAGCGRTYAGSIPVNDCKSVLHGMAAVDQRRNNDHAPEQRAPAKLSHAAEQ